MADPDFELRGVGGGGLDLLAMAAIFPSVILFFLPKIRGGPGPPGPSPRSATGDLLLVFNLYQGRSQLPGDWLLTRVKPLTARVLSCVHFMHQTTHASRKVITEEA